MTKMFYDGLINDPKQIEDLIKKTASSQEEKDENGKLVDELINYKVFEKVLDELPQENHAEFLELVVKSPHDETLIFAYVKEKTGKDIQEELGEELDKVFDDLTNEFKPHDEVTAETRVSTK